MIRGCLISSVTMVIGAAPHLYALAASVCRNDRLHYTWWLAFRSFARQAQPPHEFLFRQHPFTPSRRLFLIQSDFQILDLTARFSCTQNYKHTLKHYKETQNRRKDDFIPPGRKRSLKTYKRFNRCLDKNAKNCSGYCSDAAG